MKTKTKLFSLVAILAAFLMFFASMMTLGVALRAHADQYDEWKFPAFVSDKDYETNIDESLTSLYYFSDYYESQDYFDSGFVRQYINWNTNVTYSELIYNEDDFWLYTKSYISTIDPALENAFVIFEVRNSMPWKDGIFYDTDTEEVKIGKSAKTIYPFLADYFASWKANNCKIMFISGKDEAWFEYYNEFLDYVDIHINFDVLTEFAYTVACEMVESENLQGASMIFDNVMAQDEFLVDYFIPYLYFVYYNEGQYPADVSYPATVADAFQPFDMKVYFYNYVFFMDMEGNIVAQSAVENDFDASELSCVIASSESLSARRWMWDQFRPDANFYVYNDQLLGVYQVPSGVAVAGIPRELLNYYLQAIMRDFILNDLGALQKYDNREGRCVVTFTSLFSGDGWLRRAKAYTLPSYGA